MKQLGDRIEAEGIKVWWYKPGKRDERTLRVKPKSDKIILMHRFREKTRKLSELKTATVLDTPCFPFSTQKSNPKHVLRRKWSLESPGEGSAAPAVRMDFFSGDPVILACHEADDTLLLLEYLSGLCPQEDEIPSDRDGSGSTLDSSRLSDRSTRGGALSLKDLLLFSRNQTSSGRWSHSIVEGKANRSDLDQVKTWNISAAVPMLPSNHVSRTAHLEPLIEMLTQPYKETTAGSGARVKPPMTVIVSKEASGKSVLAAAAAAEQSVWDVYRGRVLWLNVGEKGLSNIIDLLQDSCMQLIARVNNLATDSHSAGPDHFFSVTAAKHYLAMLVQLVDGPCLAVLDDVWDCQVPSIFQSAGLSVLVTTRKAEMPIFSSFDPPRRLALPEQVDSSTAEELIRKTSRIRSLPPCCPANLTNAFGTAPLSLCMAAARMQIHVGSCWSSIGVARHSTLCSVEAMSRTGLGGAGFVLGMGGKAQPPRSSPPPLGSQHPQPLGSQHPPAAPTSELELQLQLGEGGTAGITDEEEPLPQALRLAMEAATADLPEDHWDMYCQMSVLPPCTPVNLRLLGALWQVDARTAAVVACILVGRYLLCRVEPGTLSIRRDQHRYLNDDATLGVENMAAQREASAANLSYYLCKLSTLREYHSREGFQRLRRLWKACGSHFSEHSDQAKPPCLCMYYLKGAEQLRPENPESQERELDDADTKIPAPMLRKVELALILEMIGDFAAGCACGLPRRPIYREALECLEAVERWSGHVDQVILEEIEGASAQIMAKMVQLVAEAQGEEEALDTIEQCLAQQQAKRVATGIATKMEIDVKYTKSNLLLAKGKVAEGMKALDEAASLSEALYGKRFSASLILCMQQASAVLLMSSGEHRQALDLFKSTNDSMVSIYGEGHPLLGEALDTLGSLYGSAGKLTEADRCLKDALQLKQKQFLEGDPVLARTFSLQADLLVAQGQVQQAIVVLKECLAVEEDAYGKLHPCLSYTLEQLINVQLMAMGQVQGIQEAGGTTATIIVQAESNLKRCLGLHAQWQYSGIPILHNGSVFCEPSEVAQTQVVKGLTGIQIITGRPQEAKEISEKIIQRFEEAGKDKHGSILYASSLDALVNATTALGGDAESLMWDLLAADEEIYGRHSPKMAADMDQLARVMCDAGRYSEAEPWVRRSLKIIEADKAPNYESLYRVVSNLALLLFIQQAYREAESLFERALNISREVNGEQHPQTVDAMRNVGMVYCKQGKHQLAEPYYRDVIELDKAVFGREDVPEIVHETNVLAMVLLAQGKRDEAEPLLEKVLKLREDLHGPDHVEVAESWHNLGLLYDYKGLYTLALPKFVKALELLKGVTGGAHADTLACMARIAEIHQKIGNYPAAEAAFEETLVMHEQRLGADHPLVADILHDLGELLRLSEKVKQAEKVHLRALKIRERCFGPMDQSVAQSAQCLSLLLSHAGKYAEAEKFQQRLVSIREQQAPGTGTAATTENNNLMAAVEKSVANLRHLLKERGDT
ncbi:unnamed protein product [Chrysoparadoxa australica]